MRAAAFLWIRCLAAAWSSCFVASRKASAAAVESPADAASRHFFTVVRSDDRCDRFVIRRFLFWRRAFLALDVLGITVLLRSVLTFRTRTLRRVSDD